MRYPDARCTGTATCPHCPRFRCAKCGEDVPYCFGADDDQPDWCDDCWALDYLGVPDRQAS